MKERSTHAGNVTTRQLQSLISLDTSKRYMRERNTHAGNVITRQLQRVISLDTSKRYMRERSTHVICAAIKQLRMTGSRHTRIKCIRPNQYNYSRSLILNMFNIVFFMKYKLLSTIPFCLAQMLLYPHPHYVRIIL